MQRAAMPGDATDGGSMPLAFQQIHIDAARNATDDFNPFHDPRKARLVRGNPFAGTIVLGFQLEGLIEHAIDLHRDWRPRPRRAVALAAALGACLTMMLGSGSSPFLYFQF